MTISREQLANLERMDKMTKQERKAKQDRDRAENNRRMITSDVDAGRAIGRDMLGPGLGRIQDDADVRSSKNLMRQRAEEGMSTREENAMRERGLNQMQGSERKAQRGLNASLARSGVRGGAAGQAQVELAAKSMQNRRAFETDLIMSDEAAKRKAETDFANFSTKLAEFDLAQEAKELNVELQSGLAFAQLGTNERGARQNAKAQKDAARAGSNSCFPAGTVIDMEDGSKKDIKDIRIGDITKAGGKVTAVHQFANTALLYLYRNVLVTGGHAALHNGLFERVEFIIEAEETRIVPSIVYNISTKNHLLSIKGHLFLDYAETDYDLTDHTSLAVVNKEWKQSVG